MAETIRRLLFIVGSKRPDFYESLRRTFRGDDTVQWEGVKLSPEKHV